ncbi:hypothetical protein [Streptosporangium fragile]|uniref:hypothetical protein n=1 Tax=Streptosporangium fragile TaxID=46186 RepID=UPI0031EBFE9E
MGMELITGGRPSAGREIFPTSPGRGTAPGGPAGGRAGSAEPSGLFDAPAEASGFETFPPDPAPGPSAPAAAHPALTARATIAAAILVV